jgi:hypothetical protein
MDTTQSFEPASKFERAISMHVLDQHRLAGNRMQHLGQIAECMRLP